MAKQEYKHPDFLGQTLEIGDMVAFSQGESSTMAFGRVTGFTEKRIQLEGIPLPNTHITVGRFRKNSISRTVNQVVKLPIMIQDFKDYPVSWIRQVFVS